MLILVLTGVAGLSTVLLSLALGLNEKNRDILAADLNVWRQNPGVLLMTFGTLLAGLVLMFVGLLLAKKYERSLASMRRLLYGYNTALSLVLLLLVLLLVNVLSYSRWIRPLAFFSRTIDWTASHVYSLSPSTIKDLQAMQQPVKIYVMLTQSGSSLNNDVETLLENCRSYNPRITWTSLSRDKNRKEIQDLMSKYKFPEPEGLLVVVNSDKEELSQFIPRNDLSNEGMRGQTEAQFNGEAVLKKTLDFLASGKAKTVVYFAQGQGELSVTDRDDQKIDVGLGKLWDRLGDSNFELKEFKFGVDKPEDLKKADVVVLAGGNRYPQAAQDALRDYLKGDGKKKGKLMVLMDTNIRKGKMEDTGLEPLLAEYNVTVQKDLVLNPTLKDPLLQIGMVDRAATIPLRRHSTTWSDSSSRFTRPARYKPPLISRPIRRS